MIYRVFEIIPYLWLQGYRLSLKNIRKYLIKTVQNCTFKWQNIFDFAIFTPTFVNYLNGHTVLHCFRQAEINEHCIFVYNVSGLIFFNIPSIDKY